jgi:hypothetical protein
LFFIVVVVAAAAAATESNGGIVKKGRRAIGMWAKVEAVDAATAIFSDAGACTCIFLGRFVCVRKQAFYGRIKLELPGGTVGYSAHPRLIRPSCESVCL